MVAASLTPSAELRSPEPLRRFDPENTASARSSRRQHPAGEQPAERLLPRPRAGTALYLPSAGSIGETLPRHKWRLCGAPSDLARLAALPALMRPTSAQRRLGNARSRRAFPDHALPRERTLEKRATALSSTRPPLRRRHRRRHRPEPAGLRRRRTPGRQAPTLSRLPCRRCSQTLLIIDRRALEHREPLSTRRGGARLASAARRRCRGPCRSAHAWCFVTFAWKDGLRSVTSTGADRSSLNAQALSPVAPEPRRCEPELAIPQATSRARGGQRSSFAERADFRNHRAVDATSMDEAARSHGNGRRRRIGIRASSPAPDPSRRPPAAQARSGDCSARPTVRSARARTSPVGHGRLFPGRRGLVVRLEPCPSRRVSASVALLRNRVRSRPALDSRSPLPRPQPEEKLEPTHRRSCGIPLTSSCTPGMDWI